MKLFWIGFFVVDLLALGFLHSVGPFVVPVGNAEILISLPWQTLPPPGAKPVAPNRADVPTHQVQEKLTILPKKPAPLPVDERARIERIVKEQEDGYYVAPGIYKCLNGQGSYTLQDKPC